MMKFAEDEVWMNALSEGNMQAFEKLFLRYHPKLLFFLNGFIHDEESCRDMAQDIFFSLWLNRERLTGVRSFQAYLYGMARNTICNYYDHTLVKEKFTAEQIFQPVVTDNVEEKLFVQNLQALIDLKVEQMPPRQRTIYRMSRIDGISNEDIASKLQISKRTVENYLTKALADIRKVIKSAFLLFY